MKSKHRTLILILGIMALVFGTMVKSIGQEKEWLVVVYGNWGMRVVNWSPKRKMVATAIVPKQVPIWVPGGWGWYETGNLEKVAQLDGGKNIMDKVIFYNFGLLPDKIINSKEELSVDQVWRKWSKGRWLWWKWEGSSWIIREDELGLAETGEIFNNWDKQVITGYTPIDRGGVEWRVYNGTEQKGLGSFMAQRLVWAGMWVSNVANIGPGETKLCQIKYNLEGTGNNYLSQINKVNQLWNCELKKDLKIKMGVEMVIGRGMADLLKYSSYVRTF